MWHPSYTHGCGFLTLATTHILKYFKPPENLQFCIDVLEMLSPAKWIAGYNISSQSR